MVEVVTLGVVELEASGTGPVGYPGTVTLLELTGRVAELETTVLELADGIGPVGYPGTLAVLELTGTVAELEMTVLELTEGAGPVG